MVAIVDSGSTKCDWIILDNDGMPLGEKIRTKGLNPAILSSEELTNRIQASEELLKFKDSLKSVYFYGAGCGTPKARKNLEIVLQQIFAKANCKVEEDTWAGVYSTINSIEEAAVVCILGTGSNCSYYDGKSLHQRVKSLGYSIMDDAAGNYFGRQLIRAYYFKKMPKNIALDFEKQFDLNPDVIKHNLYKEPNPNAYLASFASFMFRHQKTDFMQSIIKNGIREFTKSMVLQYQDVLDAVPVHFAGSIAYFCQEEIIEVATESNFRCGNFVRRPIEGLVAFHQRLVRNKAKVSKS
ncbi:MAG: N-acetylglucosamine kinase [Flavobacteriaceae bacterium]|nr:N-acetylglucosamine kinase [Flavobacteriaceae bacterium]